MEVSIKIYESDDDNVRTGQVLEIENMYNLTEVMLTISDGDQDTGGRIITVDRSQLIRVLKMFDSFEEGDFEE